MSLNTVAEFAAELKRTPDTLLEQLQAAGVPKRSASDELTEADKQQLLTHLQSSSGVGGERKKNYPDQAFDQRNQAGRRHG